MAEKLADYDPESISSLIKRTETPEEYAKLAEVIQKEIKEEEKKEDYDGHWLYATLGMCYHGQYKYDLAIETLEIALGIAPRCPLALWYYATSLYQLEKNDESLEVLDKLLKRGVNGIAYGQCGEGVRWSKAMLNDCRFVKSLNYFAKDDFKNAKKWAKLHLRFRNQGVKSIYHKRYVLSHLRKIDLKKG